MGLLDGVSWSNPAGTGGQSPGGLANALMGKMGNGLSNLQPSNSFQNFLGFNALSGGNGTPWGPTDSKGLQGLALFNPISALPGGKSMQESVDAGLFQEKPTAPTQDKFDPNAYTTSDYTDQLNAGKNQIASNLAAQQNDIIAGQQGRGALNSGSTGLGFSQALQGSANANQGLAGTIASQKYNDALSQYNAQQAAKFNDYNNKMSKYNQNQGALGSSIGQGLSAVAAFL